MLWKKHNTMNIYLLTLIRRSPCLKQNLIQELLSIRETYQRPLCCGVDDKNQQEDEEEEEDDDEDINLGQAGEAERWINCQIQQSEANKKQK
jgi:hypothetical protein